jgi:hypothetical protein
MRALRFNLSSTLALKICWNSIALVSVTTEKGNCQNCGQLIQAKRLDLSVE